jgi:hypothetical protein
MTNRPSRGRGLASFGFFLARRGVTSALAVGLTLLIVLSCSGAAVVFGIRGKGATLARMPLIASSALAWGVGVLVAFAAASRVFGRDEEDGVRALLRARGAGRGAYLASRVTGLAALLALHVAGGSLVVGAVAALVANSRSVVLATGQAQLAATAYAVAFACVFAAVALATLGARSRVGGYLALLAVLVLPGLAAHSLEEVVATRWIEVCSVQGALAGLRASFAGPSFDPFLLGRALAVLASVVVLALLVARADLAREASP